MTDTEIRKVPGGESFFIKLKWAYCVLVLHCYCCFSSVGFSILLSIY